MMLCMMAFIHCPRSVLDSASHTILSAFDADDDATQNCDSPTIVTTLSFVSSRRSFLSPPSLS